MVNKLYPLQVWFTSLLLGPIFFFLNSISSSFNREIDVISILGFTLLAWILGVLMSVPSFIIYYFSFKGLIYLNWAPIIKKVLLSIIAIILMLTTFYIMIGEGFYEPSFLNPYVISIILSGLIFKINSTKKEIPETIISK